MSLKIRKLRIRVTLIASKMLYANSVGPDLAVYSDSM